MWRLPLWLTADMDRRGDIGAEGQFVHIGGTNGAVVVVSMPSEAYTSLQIFLVERILLPLPLLVAAIQIDATMVGVMTAAMWGLTKVAFDGVEGAGILERRRLLSY